MTTKEKLATLSQRERDVIALICTEGMSKGAAHTLGISPRTVEKHLNRIYKKLGIHTQIALTHFALAAGLAKNMFKE